MSAGASTGQVDALIRLKLKRFYWSCPEGPTACGGDEWTIRHVSGDSPTPLQQRTGRLPLGKCPAPCLLPSQKSAICHKSRYCCSRFLVGDNLSVKERYDSISQLGVFRFMGDHNDGLADGVKFLEEFDNPERCLIV